MAGVARVSGYAASYDSAGSSKFTPMLFSKKMLKNFYQTTAFNEIANTDLTK